MKLSRRQFLHLAAGAAALPAVSRIARAQTYPTRPVRLIVGFPAGGVSDIFPRLIGQWLSERLGQSFVIENRPGASGTIAVDLVVRAAPDGYTLLLTSGNDPLSESLYSDVRFNYIRDISPVASIALTPNVMEVNPVFPAKTVPEFIDYAKANPGKMNFASAGIGTGQHLCGELFKMMTGIDMLHVPLSRRGSRDCRFAWRTGAGHVRLPDFVNRVHPRRQAARAGGVVYGSSCGAARNSDHERFHSGV
jgi:tripartite-type tricarboxylate transporter receptor subunit TctC